MQFMIIFWFYASSHFYNLVGQTRHLLVVVSGFSGTVRLVVTSVHFKAMNLWFFVCHHPLFLGPKSLVGQRMQLVALVGKSRTKRHLVKEVIGVAVLTTIGCNSHAHWLEAREPWLIGV